MKCSVRILLPCLLIDVGSFKTKAQSFEVQQLILDVEKLSQLKNIYSDLVKGYEILSEGYNAVSDISQGNFDLHKLFLDGLLKASPVVQKYQKVADIINCELKLFLNTVQHIIVSNKMIIFLLMKLFTSPKFITISLMKV